jgi:hypothetical protein
MSFGVAMRNSVSLGLGGIPSLASGSRGNNPTLNLNFALTQTLDPRITFTRASTARYYNGVTTAKAEENLFTYSQEFNDASWSKNGTTATANTSVAPDGTTTADTLTENTATIPHNTNQAFTPINGVPYAFSVFVKKGTGLGARDFIQLGFSNAQFGVNSYANFDINTGTVSFTGAGLTSASIVSAGNNWYRCIIVDTSVASTATFVVISLITTGTAANQESYLGLVTADMFLWGAQLEQRSAASAYTPTTTAPITNTIPVLLTAANDVARFDHNPVTSESLGLLIEEQRTNLVTYSEQFDNAAWAKQNVTITANTIVSPDGTLDADKIIATVSTAEHTTESAFSVVAGTTYTATFFAKQSELTRIGLRFTNGAVWTGGTSPHIQFNFLTETITVIGGTIASSSFQNVGNGWYRISMSVLCSVSGSAAFRVQMANNAGGISFTGNGYDGVFIWGAQLEAATFATSYIATVASQVTRSTDTAVMTGTNFSSWYNQSEGTIVCQAIRYATGTATTGFVFQADDSTLNNRNSVAIGASGGTQLITLTVVGGAIQAQTNGTALAANKVGYAYAVDNFATSLNGGASNLDTSGTLPVVTQARIGASSAVTIYNGTIARITYYPQRLPNSQLQALTT